MTDNKDKLKAEIDAAYQQVYGIPAEPLTPQKEIFQEGYKSAAAGRKGKGKKADTWSWIILLLGVFTFAGSLVLVVLMGNVPEFYPAAPLEFMLPGWMLYQGAIFIGEGLDQLLGWAEKLDNWLVRKGIKSSD